jgi:hypothetical protein
MWFYNNVPAHVFTPGEDDVEWMIENGYVLVLEG